ncbi:MAG: hypothetical protein ACI4JB_10280 [Porcipelethomonas sp.]
MAIDISNRSGNHVRKAVIPQKHQGGISYERLAVAALAFAAVGFAGITFSESLNSVLSVLIKIVSQAAVPLACFLAARRYYTTKNVKRTAAILGILAVLSHIPYVWLVTGKFGFFSGTGLMFPLFMGFAALIVRDIPGIDINVKNIVVILACVAAVIGEGGCAAAVWMLIFGGNYDKRIQIRYFSITAIAVLVVHIIVGAVNGCWYEGLYHIGYFIAVPFISRYNPRAGRSSGNGLYGVLYIVWLLAFAIIKAVIY